MVLVAALTACDTGSGKVDLRVHVQRATVERCSELRSFSLRIAIDNRGDAPVQLKDITLSSDADLVTGTLGFEPAGATLAAGQSVVYLCTGGADFGWPSSDPSALYGISARVREKTGFGASADGPLRFFELFDNCNTAFPEPHPCRPSE